MIDWMWKMLEGERADQSLGFSFVSYKQEFIRIWGDEKWYDIDRSRKQQEK